MSNAPSPRIHVSTQPFVTRIQLAADTILKDIPLTVPELRMVVLSTADGLPLTSLMLRGGDASRVSAMVSSLLAICESASKELAAGACNSAIVTAERLNIIAIRVGERAWPLVLAAAFDAEMMLGAALRRTTDLGSQITAAVVDAARRGATA